MKRLCKLVCMILAITLLFSSCVGGVFSQEPQLTESEIYAQSAITFLKSDLRNPSSLQIHSMEYVSVIDNDMWIIELLLDTLEKQNEVSDVREVRYVYKIDYSAENGFGGTNREMKIIPVRNDKSSIELDGTMFAEVNFKDLYSRISSEYGSSFIDLTRIGY